MKRLFKILFILGCLSVIFVNVVSAYNSTTTLHDVDSYGYGTPDYLVLTNKQGTNTSSLTITPTQTVSVPDNYTYEQPYISNTTANIYGQGNPIFYVPETITVGGDPQNPLYVSELNFGATGIYDVAHDYLYQGYGTDTMLHIGYDEFYLPMTNTGAGQIKYDIPFYPYYEFRIPQYNNANNYVRADYKLEYYVYDEAGNASVVEKHVRVLIYPSTQNFQTKENTYIIPVLPFGIPSTTFEGFLTYTPEFNNNGYTISNATFTDFVTENLSGIHRAYDNLSPYTISKLTDFTMDVTFTSNLKSSFNGAIGQVGNSGDVLFTRHSFLGTNFNHSYTDAFYQENYDIRFGSSLAGRITDGTSWINWLIDSIDAFMDIRLGQNFTIGTVSLVALSITTVILILKFFAGG